MAYSDSLHKVKIQTVDGEIECVGGSYAGVPFFFSEGSTSGGRNVVTTALPYTNKHINEDQGLKPKKFELNFYLVGENVEWQREQLEAAFEKEGKQEFIHPHYGKFFARCDSFSFSYSREELEYVTGSASITPEEEVKATAQNVVDLRGQSVEKANSVLDDAAAAFKAAFSYVDKAANVVNKINDAAVGVIDAIEDARNYMRKVTGFVLAVSQLRDNISTILKTPAEFAQRLQNIITLTEETFFEADQMNYANEALALMDKIEVNQGSLTSDEMQRMIQKMALMDAAAMLASSVMNAKFENAEQVYEMQARIDGVFARAMAKVDDLDNYMALADLAATVNKYLMDYVANLAVVVELPLLETRDALSACFDCYGSLDKLDEVLARNAILDPAIITRKSLKVLSK